MIPVHVDPAKNTKTAMAKYYLGLMSGTSLDGVDAVLMDEDCRQVVGSYYLPYSAKLKAELLDLTQSDNTTLQQLSATDIAVAEHFADCANALVAHQQIDTTEIGAIGSHGQTIYHQGGVYSHQIGHGAIIAQKTGINVVNDFRMADVTAGGQGAPLTPLYHQHLLSGEPGVVVNLGGIANISIIGEAETLGFDSGPANTLIDNWTRACKGLDYDRDGIWSRSGFVLQPMLEAMLDDAYFQQAAPKSTGPEYFNLTWLRGFLPSEYQEQDVARTLIELSVLSISQHIPKGENVYLCGGGVHNLFLAERLAYLNPDSEVGVTNDLGVHVDFVEAAAFAFFAKQTLDQQPSNLPSVTGASTEKILGAMHVH